MKIYCMTCREHILNSTDKIKIGGPYQGDMFEPVQKNGYWGRMFHHSAKRGNLFCPRCEGPFIRRGELLTEHGIIREGQTTVDETLSIVAPPDNPLPGRIMGMDYSREAGVVVEQLPEAPVSGPNTPDRFDIPAAENESACGKDDCRGECHEESTTELKEGVLKCPNCQKTYKNKGRGPEFYAKHIESCG